MSWQHREYREDGTYWVAARGDDDARTITTYAEDGAVLSVRDYTDTENRQADQQEADRAQDAALLDHEARLARIEAHLWPPDPTPTPGNGTTARTWAEHGGVWPHGTILDDGGIIWRNIAKVPLTEPPSRFPGQPGQWAHLFVEVKTPVEEPKPPVEEWPAWEPWDHIRPLHKVGAKVTHKGRRWVSTASNNHWEPGVYGWTDHGPA